MQGLGLGVVVIDQDRELRQAVAVDGASPGGRGGVTGVMRSEG
jgi:hypothetical protein